MRKFWVSKSSLALKDKEQTPSNKGLVLETWLINFNRRICDPSDFIILGNACLLSCGTASHRLPSFHPSLPWSSQLSYISRLFRLSLEIGKEGATLWVKPISLSSGDPEYPIPFPQELRKPGFLDLRNVAVWAVFCGRYSGSFGGPWVRRRMLQKGRSSGVSPRWWHLSLSHEPWGWSQHGL